MSVWRRVRELLTDESALAGFVERNFYIAGKPAKLTPYQLKFLKAVLSRKHGKYVMLSCTRAGKTTVTSIAAVLFAVLYPFEDVVVVAPTFRQAKILMDNVRQHILSNRLFIELVDKTHFRRDEIWLINGSTLKMLSAGNPESLLGHGASVLIVDEAGSIPDEVFRTRVLRMLMSPRNKLKPVLILLGTPHVMNYFYDAWRSDDFWKLRVTWREAVAAGVMREEEVEYARKVMTDKEFRMWYEAEFVSGEDVLFDLGAVRELAVGRPVRESEHVPGTRYFAGLDIARFGSDESAYVVVAVPSDFTVESGTAEVVAYYRRRRRPLSDIIGWAVELTRKWCPEAVAVDCVGLGAGVYDVLRERLGGRVVCVGERGRERTEMYLFLRRLVAEKRIVLPRDEYFIQQFGSYSITYRSDGAVLIRKSPKMRDDLVDALAMALYVAAFRCGAVVYPFLELSEFIDGLLGGGRGSGLSGY